MLQGIYHICFQSSLATVGEAVVVFHDCGVHGAGEGHVYRGRQRKENGSHLLEIEIEHVRGPRYPAFGPLTRLRANLEITEVHPCGFKATGNLVESASIRVNVVAEKMGELMRMAEA